MFHRSRFSFSSWGVVAAFLLTVAGARSVSSVAPWFHIQFAGFHVHHYVYGIFILAAAGYLALIFKSPRATSWIAMLYGLGLGLTFDEFGFWVNPVFVRGVRWNSRGIAIVIVALVLASLTAFLRTRRSSDVPTSETLKTVEENS